MNATTLTTLLADPTRAMERVRSELLRLPVLRQLDDALWRRALAAHAAALPRAGAVERALLAVLEQEGAVVTSLADLGLPSVDTLLASLDGVSEQLDRLAERDEVSTRSPVEPLLHRVPLLLRVALDERLLTLAHRLIGLPPRVCAIGLREDRVVPVSAGLHRWHLDPEDRRMLKAIVYLHDVDPDDGPFEFVPLADSARIAATLRYTRGYLEDAAVDPHLPDAARRACPGPAGTVILADTCRVLHRARTPRAGPRRSLTFSFTSQHPRRTYPCERPLGLTTLATTLSRCQRAALPPAWLAS